MGTDLYFSEAGDIGVSNNGDLATTSSHVNLLEQNARIRLATRKSDFQPYPRFGADMQRMIGLPNTPQTARFGKALIERGLLYDSFIARAGITVDATPTAPDTITFDIYVPYGYKQFLTITLTQLLTVAR